MYKNKEPEPIQNDKCVACKFCGWDSERKEDACSIKGCWHNSKFVPFNFNEWADMIKRSRK